MKVLLIALLAATVAGPVSSHAEEGWTPLDYNPEMNLSMEVAASSLEAVTVSVVRVKSRYVRKFPEIPFFAGLPRKTESVEFTMDFDCAGRRFKNLSTLGIWKDGTVSHPEKAHEVPTFEDVGPEGSLWDSVFRFVCKPSGNAKFYF